ncbi:MAG: AbrB/MazE/SpoVT family DNA-binding domain-containing protein [Candidatus Acididesulfobacter diazotrophicus]|jgi:antitoxin MazE|uniref:AbrB/MazE/SpoVT family DNA-binding domain-containing protein n=1 Tax=Candidatus Acididesulfobacter diazotrophicus TaxID=2597226 RepID=A0A519BJP7_9DELT|nr:MAG: AbrB/MazE/SpoVT family DNA-binding domain-containing protein [Candidatus Acididesulfobacter diazotrophicus]
MILKIISIGNSKGIRIPSNIIKMYNINDLVDIELSDNQIILKPINKPRIGWNEAFKNMRENNDDGLIIQDDIDLNFEEWEWK